jgi:hypothetical protein
VVHREQWWRWRLSPQRNVTINATQPAAEVGAAETAIIVNQCSYLMIIERGCGVSSHVPTF